MLVTQVIDLGNGHRVSWDGTTGPMRSTTDSLGGENMVTLHDTMRQTPGSLAVLLGQEVTSYKFGPPGWRLRIIRVFQTNERELFAYAKEEGGGGIHIRIIQE